MFTATLYRNLPIKRPWALEIHSQKTGVGVYTEKPICTHIHTDHKIIKKRGWALIRIWALTRENTVHCVLAQANSYLFSQGNGLWCEVDLQLEDGARPGPLARDVEDPTLHH